MGIADHATSSSSEEKVVKSGTMISDKDQTYSHNEVAGLGTYSDEAARPEGEVPVSSDRMLLCSSLRKEHLVADSRFSTVR